mmetsp:Transcript_11016/g.13337  ORF Transcript_11016/g.13337 Transcript_11016/m.13337 type:complete len:233 (+) Transcript_11016:1429-2127(+)
MIISSSSFVHGPFTKPGRSTFCHLCKHCTSVLVLFKYSAATLFQLRAPIFCTAVLSSSSSALVHLPVEFPSSASADSSNFVSSGFSFSSSFIFLPPKDSGSSIFRGRFRTPEVGFGLERFFALEVLGVVAAAIKTESDELWLGVASFTVFKLSETSAGWPRDFMLGSAPFNIIFIAELTYPKLSPSVLGFSTIIHSTQIESSLRSTVQTRNFQSAGISLWLLLFDKTGYSRN